MPIDFDFIREKFFVYSHSKSQETQISHSLGADGDLQFKSRTIWAQPRQLQMIYDTNAPRSDDILIVCSWCKKINTNGEVWEEIEEAVVTLGLFEFEWLPQLSHGMCGDCYRIITKEYQAHFNEINSERTRQLHVKSNESAI